MKTIIPLTAALLVCLPTATPHARTSAQAPATQPATKPARAAEDGSVLLHAKDATVHGTTVRYEPQPNKNTIGYWTRKDDWVSWEFELAKPGRFTVILLQGCGKGSGGSQVECAVENQVLKTTVVDTGGFQNFVPRDIGKLDLPAGTHTLTVKPLTKPGLAVMDLRQVTLRPAGE